MDNIFMIYIYIILIILQYYYNFIYIDNYLSVFKQALEPSVVSILLLPKCQNPTSLNLNTKNTVSL